MKTAIIMSKEEAMALPLKKRPICFRISSEIYHKTFEQIGYASMCWSPKPSSEVFDAEKASNAAVELCFAIAEESEKGKWDVLRVAADSIEKMEISGPGACHEIAKRLREESLANTGKYIDRELAKMFGVARSVVNKIRNRKLWSWVK